MKHAILIGLVLVLVLPARGQEPARDWYELHGKAAGGWNVVYFWAGGARKKVVDAEKPAYLVWRAAGNMPAEKPYVPREPAKDTRPVEVRKLDAIRRAAPPWELAEALFEAHLGNGDRLAAAEAKRAAAATAFDAANPKEPGR